MNFIFDPSLVLYLPLYERDGSSFMSRDAYGHLCTVTGAVWRPWGRYFDGTDDYIDCGDKSVFPSSADDFSLSTWIKTSSTSQQGIISRDVGGAGHDYYWKLEIKATTGYPRFVCFNTAGSAYVDATGPSSVADGAWHHLGVAWKSAKEAVLCVDGDNVASDTSFSGTLKTGTCNLHVGQHEDGRMAGDIDEVVVLKRTLTPLELQNIYLATKWRYQ